MLMRRGRNRLLLIWIFLLATIAVNLRILTINTIGAFVSILLICPVVSRLNRLVIHTHTSFKILLYLEKIHTPFSTTDSTILKESQLEIYHQTKDHSLFLYEKNLLQIVFLNGFHHKKLFLSIHHHS